MAIEKSVMLWDLWEKCWPVVWLIFPFSMYLTCSLTLVLNSLSVFPTYCMQQPLLRQVTTYITQVVLQSTGALMFYLVDPLSSLNSPWNIWPKCTRNLLTGFDRVFASRHLCAPNGYIEYSPGSGLWPHHVERNRDEEREELHDLHHCELRLWVKEEKKFRILIFATKTAPERLSRPELVIQLLTSLTFLQSLKDFL